MNAKETLEAAALMREYAEEWQRTGREPMWLEIGATVPDSDYAFCAVPAWNWRHCHYRRKPEPKTVPLGLEDMVPGIQFRLVGGDIILFPGKAGVSGLEPFDKGAYVDWKSLAISYEYRTPAESTWRPCVKEVQ